MKLLLALGVVAALLLAGCGGSGAGETGTQETSAQEQPATTEPRPDPKAERREELKLIREREAAAAKARKENFLEITIDGYPNAEYGGLFLAERRGYFKDVGLGIHIHTPLEPSRPVRYVAERSVPLAVTHQPEVTLARSRGTPIIAVASLLPRPTTSLIWLRDSGIESIADLKGKTIATERLESQEKLLQAILARAGLNLDDVNVIRPRYQMIPALKSGRADAAIGGSWNVEGIELRQQGFDPVVVPVSKLGIPDYEELVLIEREDQLAVNREFVHKFLSALRRGNRAAIAHPGAAVAALKAANPELDVKATAKGVAVTSPMLPQDFHMDPAGWRGFEAWMTKNGLLENPPPPSRLFTNAYLP